MEKTSLKKNKQASESLQEQIIKLEKQLESFKHSNDHFLKNKLFLHYDIKEPEKVVVDCETKLPVITEVDKKKIEKGKDSELTHLIIEGDNYHALSVLNYTHTGKIDIIYIDPPYNTGNKDFIYNDRFVDREDSFRHSKWLSFMAHRLRLAKTLLAETGVIFISIDDNEQAHLRLLCDQIFGEKNFKTTVIWQKKTRPSNKNNDGFSSTTEYILMYSKKIDALKLLPVDLNQEYVKKVYKNPDNDPRGPWRGQPLWSESNTNKRKSLLLPDGRRLEQKWFISQNTLNELFADGRIVESKKGTLNSKIFLSEIDGKDPMNFLSGDLVGTTEEATKELKSILGSGENIFMYPKPVRLIKFLISRLPNNCNSIVLDFFAGSGTTGHAVLDLNVQDRGTRQFILCTNNENGIAENVTYSRIKKVIAGYGDNAPIPANLRYFQTDFVEKKGSASQIKFDLTRQCAEMLCVKENVFEAVKLKKRTKNYKFFKNGDKYLGVFFDFFTDAEFGDFIKELNALPKEVEKVVYVFVLDGSAGILADEFLSVANCAVKEIPQKILDIYKQIASEGARK